MDLNVSPLDTPFKIATKVPGDKSISHRAAIIAAISDGECVLENFSTAVDCDTTLNCLMKLGIKVEKSGSTVTIKGKGLNGLAEPGDVLDCGNSATTMRLLCGLMSGQNFTSVLNGDKSLRQRPMDRIINPLRSMGARITARSGNKHAPITITGGILKAIDYTLPVASSQVKSALILAGLFTNGYQSITEPVETRDHTERMLRLFKVNLLKENNRIKIGHERQPKATHISIPGDISSAAFIIALGLLNKNSAVKITDVGVNVTRTGFIKVLLGMGGKIEMENNRVVSNEPIANITSSYSSLKAATINDELIPNIIDELPILTVLATQAHGTTIFHNAQELRYKETDRLAAITNELTKMGAKISEHNDGLTIEGATKLQGSELDTHGDHRIAMALTVAAMISKGDSIIKNADCIAISYPGFTETLKNLGATIKEV